MPLRRETSRHGRGVEEEFEEDLAPAETQTLELELEPGIYEIYCPVSR